MTPATPLTPPRTPALSFPRRVLAWLRGAYLRRWPPARRRYLFSLLPSRGHMHPHGLALASQGILTDPTVYRTLRPLGERPWIPVDATHAITTQPSFPLRVEAVPLQRFTFDRFLALPCPFCQHFIYLQLSHDGGRRTRFTVVTDGDLLTQDGPYGSIHLLHPLCHRCATSPATPLARRHA